MPPRTAMPSRTALPFTPCHVPPYRLAGRARLWRCSPHRAPPSAVARPSSRRRKVVTTRCSGMRRWRPRAHRRAQHRAMAVPRAMTLPMRRCPLYAAAVCMCTAYTLRAHCMCICMCMHTLHACSLHHMPPHAQVVALPAPADTVFSRATLGLGGHGALVAATQAWCANMRATRSIATSCMRLPAHASSAAAAAAESWVPVSVCCSSDLCQIRDGAATAAFSHAALDDGAGLDCNPGCDPGLRLTPCNPGCNPACPACSPMHLRCGRARVLPPQGRSDRSGRRWRTHRLGS